MNGSVIRFFIAVCVICASPVLFAQVPPVPPPAPSAPVIVPDPGIPRELKISTDLSSDSDKISGPIVAEIAKMADDSNADVQSAARDWLIDEATIKDSPSSTSVAYITEYAAALNAACVAQLSEPGASPHFRLNVGVVVSRVIQSQVVQNADNTHLMPTLLLLLQDKNPGVVIWGERGAGNFLDSILKPNSPASDSDRSAVMAAMVAAVEKNPDPPLGGLIADEAYRALFPTDRHLHFQLSDTAQKALVDTNLQLQKSRLKLYITGVPEWPDADTYATNYVTGKAIWNIMTPEQQEATMQQASDMIALAGHRAVQRAPDNAELVIAIKHEGFYVEIVAYDLLRNDTLKNAAASVYALSPTSKPEAISAAIARIYPNIQKLFPNVTPPPELPGETAESTQH
jgi:hypothetical protein